MLTFRTDYKEQKHRFAETLITTTFSVVLMVGCANFDAISPDTEARIDGDYLDYQRALPFFDLQTLKFADPDIGDHEASPSRVAVEFTPNHNQSYSSNSREPASIQYAVLKQTHYENAEHTDTITSPLFEPKEEIDNPPSVFRFFFSEGQMEINAHDLGHAAAHANYLRHHPNLILIINGHAYDEGSEQTNLQLSELRAKRLYDLLISMGVADSQLITDCYGSTVELQDSNRRRRVELEYSELYRL